MFPDATFRAFADDIGAVVPHIRQEWGDIVATFTGFAEISGLHINPEKTVIMPLWHSNENQIRLEPWFANTEWNHVKVEYKSKYLGIVIGPRATPEVS